MSEVSDESFRLRTRVLVFWILFFSFIVFVLLTIFLVYQGGGAVQFTLIFVDTMSNILAIILVVFYLTLGLPLTWYFYRRALAFGPDKGYIYALASIVIGVSVPYIYALLLSFMGIMRYIFPILYVVFFYIMGVLVGLRMIPSLIAHIRSE
ncbi:MAG: hypothetical protein ACFFDJ_04470 [Candidatus Odinarchaeota archaeon]